jgi:hypothetical protein
VSLAGVPILTITLIFMLVCWMVQIRRCQGKAGSVPDESEAA